MKKNMVEHCIIEPFVPLLNICLSEEYLNNIIMESDDLSLLHIGLRVKYYYVSQGVQQKVSFPINKILQRMSNANIEKICEILELCILVQNIEFVSTVIIEHLQKMKITEQQDIYIILKLLDMITNTYSSFNLQFPNFFDETLIKHLYREIFNSTSKQLKSNFCKFLPKYVNCSNDPQSIMYFILSFEDLYTISCCTQSFINSQIIMDNKKFWLMIGDSLQASDYNKKLSLNILKCYIQYVSKNGNFAEQLNIIKGNAKTELEFSRCWSNYFILVEISEEKQLHLLTPALPLLSKVNELHTMWVITLYKIFLSHVQSSIIFAVANITLKLNLVDQIELFENIIRCLLPALNRYEHADNFLTVFENLNSMSQSFRHEHFCILLRETLNINWSSVPAWYIYSYIFANVPEHNIDFALIINNINCIKTLPHTFIRDSCYLVLVKLIVQKRNFQSLNLYEFINLAYELKKCDVKLLSIFFKYAHHNLLTYNSSKSTEINIATFKKYFGKTDILLRILQNNSDISLTIFNLLNTSIKNLEDEEYFVSYLSKHNFKGFNTVEYLQQKLETLNSSKNIGVLCEIASRTKTDDATCSSLLKKCKTILFETNKYSEHCVALAFDIYSYHADDDIEKVLREWNTKLISGGNIQSIICKSYLNIYFKHMRVSNQSFSTPQEIHQILSLIFDTQSEDIWLDIYENFDVLLNNLQCNQILAVLFEKVFKELVRFKSTENLIKAWSAFVKIILHNRNIFAINNIRVLLINNIYEITLGNDLVAYIFICELLNVNDNDTVLSFLHLVVDLILNGGIYKKDKRCEYYACREIDKNIKLKNNPIYLPCNLRCTASNIVLCILNSNGANAAHMLTKLLLEKYSQYYKKRYFPESQIHLSKLRIIQTLLILTPYANDDNKKILVEFIIDSFCEESHQPCVKQLMQLLLIILLRDNREHLHAISKKMDKASRTHASTIAAFVPVLSHVGYAGDEELIEELIQLILEWTMGAHFKLRVYSQVAIIKLMEASMKRNYTQIVNKYKFLYDSVKTVLDMTGTNVENVLQTDKFFLDQFNLEDYYNLETIYINIPQLNDVTETEWEYIDLEIFTNCKLIPVAGCKINTDNIIKKKINISRDIQMCDTVMNIQKKILPWKDFADVEDDDRHNITELIVVASLIENSANLGGLARTCEIYGAKRLIISDRKVAEDKEFKSLSMSSEHWVDIGEVKVDDLEEYLESVKKIGYVAVGAEQTPESVNLNTYKFPKKCLLVLGNERAGIPPHILPYLDVCIEIPQFGVVRSLNVHVAGATIVWEYVKQNVLK